MNINHKFFLGLHHNYLIIDDSYTHLLSEVNKLDTRFKIKGFKSYDKALEYAISHCTDVDLIRFRLTNSESNPSIGKMIKANPNYKETKEYKELEELYAKMSSYYDNILKVEKDIQHRKTFNDGEQDDVNLDIFNIKSHDKQDSKKPFIEITLN